MPWGIASLLLTGCVTVDYLDYRGVQEWPTGSAFVRTVEGVEVFEGLPNRAYEVLGLIDVYHDQPFHLNDQARDKVMKLAKEKRADALVVLSARQIESGSMVIGQQRQDPAALDTGSSTQPELLIEEISGNDRQQTRTSYRRVLRSTILAIRWK